MKNKIEFSNGITTLDVEIYTNGGSCIGIDNGEYDGYDFYDLDKTETLTLYNLLKKCLQKD